MAIANPSQLLAVDLKARFRRQREWVEGRGRLLILAHFLSGVGAGAWLFASATNDLLGLAAGWVALGLSGLAHLAFLGRPTRFWRMIARPQSSWISRGLLGMSLLLVVGVLFLALALGGQATSLLGQGLWGLGLLGAAWVLLYKGFVWASAKGVPLWNTPLLPVLYLVYGLRGGLALLLLVAVAQPRGELAGVETLKLWLGLSSALLVLMYLGVMRGTGLTAAQSVRALLSGEAAPVFYWGVVGLGLLVPIILGALALATPLGGPLVLAVVGLSSLVGDLALLYAVARAGIYRPLPA